MKGITRSWGFVAGVRVIAVAGVVLVPFTASAQQPWWRAQMHNHARHTPHGPFLPQVTPPVIPTSMSVPDPSGSIASFQPAGPTVTAQNAFFTSLGTNGRTCFTCHQPQHAWSYGPSSVLSTFQNQGKRAPLFAAIDGADCPDTAADAEDDDDDGPACGGRAPSHSRNGDRMFVAARSQLFTKANIRVALPIPANAEWKVRIKRDPLGCETSPDYGVPAGFLSVYRRPRPSANANAFQPNTAGGQVFSIMWDGREPTLESQFIDATLGHAQAVAAPSAAQQAQGVAFQQGMFTAQDYDNNAHSLLANGAKGGPWYLASLAPFINGFGLQTPGQPPPPPAFDLFLAWDGDSCAADASVARGEHIFNTKTFTLEGVPGFNDFPGVPASFPGANCTFCHNNVDRGNDFVTVPKRLGIGDNSFANTFLPPSHDQPTFSFLCPVGSIPFFSNPVRVKGVTYDELLTSDPGAGLVTGKCADLGRMTVPILRGLAARAPYFHGGNAATLEDVVSFYNRRFNIGLTATEQQDLANFLRSL